MRISGILNKISSMLSQYKIRELLPYFLFYCLEKSKLYVNTFGSKIICIIWNVKIGEGAKFYGLPLIRKHPSGSVDIGTNCSFRSSQWSNSIGLNRKCYINASKNAEIVIGRDCGFSGTVIAATKSIIIGDRVLCGANVTISDTDRHSVNSLERFQKEPPAAKPVFIGDDVWLGMNVVVLKGVTIGNGTVVSANSVVTHTLPENVIAGGHPAVVLKPIN
ncbi:MAG: 2,3,4,5-tetrahydropyridine-2,6-dicarboxylate N-acetyltransferase [Candidatus Argoarchaeum ethanivorans]|uniref:2,3,4,5-tetrahydropyridine-2,6-dicarboxylate N-acetyltransferase n=1 Tax=Candidatus Argoarchaeum ethanivorans TaxID=2608793 RepID=A0A812A0Y7_9EURY|nr:MAG: 2,3,4,5-tetrahydropyridine-2,6-dicarboxylate N-acetyltransferase [Candidatus Argoarchaeum ethanivorans]